MLAQNRNFTQSVNRVPLRLQKWQGLYPPSILAIIIILNMEFLSPPQGVKQGWEIKLFPQKSVGKGVGNTKILKFRLEGALIWLKNI